MTYGCRTCGWLAASEPIVVDLSPREMSRLNYEDMACIVETEHFLKTGCRGSVTAYDDTLYKVGGPLVVGQLIAH